MSECFKLLWNACSVTYLKIQDTVITFKIHRGSHAHFCSEVSLPYWVKHYQGSLVLCGKRLPPDNPAHCMWPITHSSSCTSPCSTSIWENNWVPICKKDLLIAYQNRNCTVEMILIIAELIYRRALETQSLYFQLFLHFVSPQPADVSKIWWF